MSYLKHAFLVVLCWSLEQLCGLIHKMPFDDAFQKWCIKRFNNYCIFATWSFDLNEKYDLKVWKYNDPYD